MVKKYIFLIAIFMGNSVIFSKLTKDQIKFNKTFSKWKKKNVDSSESHKAFMNEIVSSYNYYYDLVNNNDDKLNKNILNKLQDALLSIMNNWNFHYYHVPLQAFYESIKNKYKNDDRFQSYFKAYKNYDKKPADPTLKAKLEIEQAKVEKLIN